MMIRFDAIVALIVLTLAATHLWDSWAAGLVLGAIGYLCVYKYQTRG